MAITSAENTVRHIAPDCLSYRMLRGGDRLIQEAKPMPSKADATTAAPKRRRSMDPAMKAGIGATACSVLIFVLFLLAMHPLPVSIG
jgi:hypothetical protein